MNIHVKIWDVAASDPCIEKIAALIEKYDCVRHVYFMSTNTERLIEMRKRLPHAGYCQGAGNGHEDMIKKAIEHKLDKVQFVYWYPYDKSMIDECHAHGIRCNFCQADTPEEAKKVFEMGIDCVLTNDFNFVKSGLE